MRYLLVLHARKTCRGRDTDDHPAYDCNEIKLIRNPDMSIEEFLKENFSIITKCSGYNAAIEKDEGC